MAELDMPDFSELIEAAELEQDAQKDRFITFRSGKEYFGLKIQYVDEIIVYQEITPVPETEDYIKGLINLRGKIIPVMDVRIRFGQEPIPYTDRTCIIVIQVGEDVVGLIVEKIAEVVEIPEKDVLPAPVVPKGRGIQSRFVYGMGKADGGVKLLLDPEKLLKDTSFGSMSKNRKKGEDGSSEDKDDKDSKDDKEDKENKEEK